MLDFLFFDEKNIVSFLNLEKLYLPLQTQSGTMCFLVPWMSGLVSGLQNRVRRFESARYLNKSPNSRRLIFLYAHKIIIMADNYLEKKMEQHASCSAAVSNKPKNSLVNLLTKNRSTRGYDSSFVVRKDQLHRIIAVNNKIASARNAQQLRFRPVLADEAGKVLPYIKMGSALPHLHLPQKCSEPNAFIVVCCVDEPRSSVYIDLGISVQSMLLQAVEMGLNGLCIMSFDKEMLIEALSLEYEPLMVVAIGKSAEKIELVDISADESYDYYRRDGVHYVPKLNVDELIIG